MSDQKPPARPSSNNDNDTPDFTPVPRQRNHASGWTPEKQRAFIGALADTGAVTEAVKISGMSESSAYRLRRSPGGVGFAHAWELAIRQTSRTLADIAFERAVKGVEDPVFDRDGQCTHVRRKYNDRLLMFLLRTHNPAQYGLGDERVVDLKKQAQVQEWADGFTPLSVALELMEKDGVPPQEEGGDDGGDETPSLPDNGQKLGE